MSAAPELAAGAWVHPRATVIGEVKDIVLDAEGKVVQGAASYVLTRASRDADQIVVGARGEGAPLSVRMRCGRPNWRKRWL